ncbi:RagB/SusD family nutrient uptake outer membrane protein [Bacteroides ihuae]|uniref:RagB/SusD family nutrient uptake outer membrane protein n=1 Tax=Bacteroides ihuae TaxID=1852362 RepID=UPI0008D931AB|nr:RagB/SusD family nutrient uptake outer membrane protein [Bacteroides ihuae]
MKKIAIILYTALISTFMIGCTDLKEEILNEQDSSQVISDSQNAKMIVAPAYAYLRDLQSRSGVWLVLESVTDELAFPTRGTDWNNADYRTLFTHEYTSKNGYIKNTWNSFMLGITKCNVALQYLTKLEQTDEIKNYVNETLFIRALCMYHLMDCFGHFPMREYTETDYSVLPKILSREEALTRIVDELKTIIPLLKEKGDVPYGRITKAAAQTLLAKVYLNYQVYTGTAPTFSDGQSKWAEASAQCDSIINSGKYTLADDFWKLYLAYNETYSDQTETILPIIFNNSVGLKGIPWLNITLHYNQKFGNFSMWNGCCTTPTFLNTWDTTDPRYQDNRLKSQVGFNLGILVGQQYSASGAELLTRTGAKLIFTPEFSIQNSSEAQGARVVKYAPDPTSTYGSNSENDFQYYRLADIYLMRAEAKYRSGDIDGALADINTLRSKRNVATYQKEDLNLEKIYNERGYEFYWDGPSRRNDMVRFNRYSEARYEKPASETSRILFPIPISAREANSNLDQNSEYE